MHSVKRLMLERLHLRYNLVDEKCTVEDCLYCSAELSSCNVRTKDRVYKINCDTALRHGVKSCTVSVRSSIYPYRVSARGSIKRGHSRDDRTIAGFVEMGATCNQDKVMMRKSLAKSDEPTSWKSKTQLRWCLTSLSSWDQAVVPRLC